jgi:hypothetical protein
MNKHTPHEFLHSVNPAMHYWNQLRLRKLQHEANPAYVMYYDVNTQSLRIEYAPTSTPGKKTMNAKQLFDSLKHIYPNLIRLEFSARGDTIVGVFEVPRGIAQTAPCTQYCHHILRPTEFVWEGEQQYPSKGISPKEAYKAIKILYPETKYIRKGGPLRNPDLPGLTRVEFLDDDANLPQETYHKILVDWGNVKVYPNE